MEAIEDSLHRAKVQQLRAWAPFVGQLMTIFRHKMTEDQWTKLKNLESDMSSAMLAGYSESRLSRLETQLNEAKAKYDSLIAMDDDQPTSWRWQPTRKLRVRVARCSQLEKMLADTLGMPPTRPDEEQILVINECKLEQSESQAERLERATIPPTEAEPDSELDVKLDVDTTTSPQLEVSIATSSSPIPGELLTNESVAEEDGLSTAKELIQNVEHEELPEIDQQPEPEKEEEQLQQVEMQVEQQSQVAIEQADKQMSESQADVNQDLVQQQTLGQNIEQQLKSDEDVVMEQKLHLKEQKENELETDAEEELTSKQGRKGFCSGNKSLFLNFNKFCNKLKSRRSHFSMSSSTNSIGSASRKNVKDKHSNSPDHSSLESKVPKLNSQPDVIVDLPSVPTVWPSENEVVPMQNIICVQNVGFCLRGSPTLKPAYYCRVPDCLFTWSNELEGLENHFTRYHPSLQWNGSCTQCSRPVKEVPDNLSIREELRHMVLQHVDVILVPKPPEPAVETAPPEPVLPKLLVRLVPEPEQATQIESKSVPQEAVDENTALSSLLVAQPCPPCCQQQQLNAAGVGELLCAKTPLTTLDVPGFINCNSELGQQINQISLADASIPLITSETVPLPVATNDDYVITQSITKYYEGPIPAEINLSIEPRPTSSPPKEDRTQNAGNLEHSVATREELQESYLPTSVALSQRIRDVLREQPAPSDTNHTISLTTLEEATTNAAEANNNTSICTIFDELLKDTGFTAMNNENTEAKPNPVEEATADALQPNQQKLINLVKASKSAQSVAQLNADEIELPIAPAKLTVAGNQMVVFPRCHFVPKELRYKCGVPDCGQHFDSELGFSQHLSTQHYHGDSFRCPHCNFKNHSLILEQVLEHLAHHKRYVYQCGACSSFATKPSIIDRHIHRRHASKLGVDVDVIIHKRDDLTTYTKLVRWFKSVNMLRTSTDEWFCNLCPTALATEHQMIGHTELSHQRKHQYCCPYCDYGFKDPIKIANHIRCSHAGKRIQPLQCYLRIKSNHRYTHGFICNTCHEATNTIRKMANHCQFAHSNRFQYKCRHCDFGHNNHHLVAAHMTQEHPGMPGLPIQQFVRLDNDMLDVDFWNKAHIFLPKKPHGAT
ncbi:uncharacterized protein LOC132791927 isoform X2 [Drosophila nasuta]|uniref:uncharacterized protein LOC132791927 isoform X2 n=1 Tax=Drosophila nasuta TaxID=42062 RepID=UPI00295E8786|nr:uncharacterized protein LOC132791927 isoform X2 [Drosophila nasuta]